MLGRELLITGGVVCSGRWGTRRYLPLLRGTRRLPRSSPHHFGINTCSRAHRTASGTVLQRIGPVAFHGGGGRSALFLHLRGGVRRWSRFFCQDLCLTTSVLKIWHDFLLCSYSLTCRVHVLILHNRINSDVYRATWYFQLCAIGSIAFDWLCRLLLCLCSESALRVHFLNLLHTCHWNSSGASCLHFSRHAYVAFFSLLFEESRTVCSDVDLTWGVHASLRLSHWPLRRIATRTLHGLHFLCWVNRNLVSRFRLLENCSHQSFLAHNWTIVAIDFPAWIWLAMNDTGGLAARIWWKELHLRNVGDLWLFILWSEHILWGLFQTSMTKHLQLRQLLGLQRHSRGLLLSCVCFFLWSHPMLSFSLKIVGRTQVTPLWINNLLLHFWLSLLLVIIPIESMDRWFRDRGHLPIWNITLQGLMILVLPLLHIFAEALILVIYRGNLLIIVYLWIYDSRLLLRCFFRQWIFWKAELSQPILSPWRPTAISIQFRFWWSPLLWGR